MGADSFRDLDRWKRWSQIAQTLPLAVLARPGYSVRALGSQAANRYAKNRVRNEKAGVLAKRREGVQIYYCIANQHIVNLCKAMCAQIEGE